MNYTNIRKDIVNKRKGLDFEYKNQASKAIHQRLFNLETYKESDVLLVYADASGEVLTDRIILKALLDGKKVYAPVCGEGYSMEFYRIYSLDELYLGHYGIREPLEIEYEKLTKELITKNTLAIVPGVAFDKENNRMGYGRGYYDRYFARYEIPNRLGLAYDFQIIDKIEAKATDIKMTGIV